MKKEKMIEDYTLNLGKKSISINNMAEELNLVESADFAKLIKIIANMEAQGKIIFTDQGEIALPKEELKSGSEIEGIFHANAQGFGFVTIDSDEPDVFIAKGRTKHALDNDTVLVQIKKPANQLTDSAAEGSVVEIKNHAVTSMIGTFTAFSPEEVEESDLLGYITGRNRKMPYRLYLSPKGLNPENNQVVKAEITHYLDDDYPDSMQGLATEIIGDSDDAGIDVLEVLEGMEIKSDFPEEVLEQANKIPEEVSESDLKDRIDYRDEIIFTIDGADAKDLDDAVHIKRLKNGNYELGVHIADVSHYVTEGSPLDLEAFERGTSVYVTDRVVPMLPERLSNGICSLNPRVNRLTQSCVMEIDQSGRVVDYQISQSVIKTVERMTYSDVNEMIKQDPEMLEKYSNISESVKDMTNLHHILEDMRHRRGALDFDTDEAKIVVDDKGNPIDIVKRSRGTAEKMIESFMLIANETVAKNFADKDLPFIYRIHEHPNAEKLTRFIDFASAFGLPVQGTAKQMSQLDLQNFMSRAKGTPGEAVLSTMLLRSMQQARYSEANLGHYGLAAENYTHFTSPIRRYPDLLVHRLIREMNHPSVKEIEKWQEKIPEIASHSSDRERRAVDAEREVEKMKKAEYMEDFVGQEFTGVISSVTKFGFFVGLENTIEGLVHVKSLKNEFYDYDERSMMLRGEKSGKVFKVGQEIKVKLTKSDKMTGDIDFEYIPSDLDIVEKSKKVNRQKNKKKSTSNSDRSKSTNKSKSSSKKKNNQPFYQKVAKNGKKGGKNAKRSRKGSRTK